MSDFHAAWARENVKAARELADDFSAKVVDGYASLFDLTRAPGETTEQLALRLAEYLGALDGTPVEPHEAPVGQDLSWLCRYGPRSMCVLSSCKCADSADSGTE